MAAPLPIRDGVAPSFLWLPRENWPDLLSFLYARFKHVPPSVVLGRLQRGELVDDAGLSCALDSPFRAGTRIWYYREVPPEIPVPFSETILYRDERILVVDKPHFLAMIPAGRHLRETLLTRLRHKLNLPELTPCHRLDRETAGVAMFCLHPPSRGAYQKLFESRDMRKVYEAVAPYRPDLSLPRLHQSRLEEGDGFFTMSEVLGEPNSATGISLIARYGEWAHYRLEPSTGKKHQLRAHLAALGIGIRHDPWYPILQPISPPDGDFSQPLQLLARSLSFIDPISGAEREFVSQRQLDLAL